MLNNAVGKKYQFVFTGKNCVYFANLALKRGGHTVQSDGSWFENPHRDPADWIDGIKKQNEDNKNTNKKGD